MNKKIQQELIVALARGWLDTPYRHQASFKGVGCDCLGLVRGIWRELYGKEPESAGPYSMDWAEAGDWAKAGDGAEASGGDKLLNAAQRHFDTSSDLSLGSLIVFRWQAHMPAKHLGIYVGDHRFIHAYERAAVISSALVPQWKKRIAGLFEFPKLTGE